MWAAVIISLLGWFYKKKHCRLCLSHRPWRRSSQCYGAAIWGLIIRVWHQNPLAQYMRLQRGKWSYKCLMPFGILPLSLLCGCFLLLLLFVAASAAAVKLKYWKQMVETNRSFTVSFSPAHISLTLPTFSFHLNILKDETPWNQDMFIISGSCLFVDCHCLVGTEHQVMGPGRRTKGWQRWLLHEHMDLNSDPSSQQSSGVSQSSQWWGKGSRMTRAYCLLARIKSVGSWSSKGPASKEHGRIIEKDTTFL